MSNREVKVPAPIVVSFKADLVAVNEGQLIDRLTLTVDCSCPIVPNQRLFSRLQKRVIRVLMEEFHDQNYRDRV